MSNIVDTLNLKLTKEGIKILSLDNSHISLIDCFVPSKFFSAYNHQDINLCDVTIGINVNILMKIMSWH